MEYMLVFWYDATNLFGLTVPYSKVVGTIFNWRPTNRCRLDHLAVGPHNLFENKIPQVFLFFCQYYVYCETKSRGGWGGVSTPLNNVSCRHHESLKAVLLTSKVMHFRERKKRREKKELGKTCPQFTVFGESRCWPCEGEAKRKGVGKFWVIHVWRRAGLVGCWHQCAALWIDIMQRAQGLRLYVLVLFVVSKALGKLLLTL